MLAFSENIIEIFPDDIYTRKEIASNCSNLSYSLLLKKEFNTALHYAQIAIQADESNEYTYTNLPLAYLFNGEFDKAKEIYLEWKDKPFQSEEQFATFKEVFLADFADLEENGVTHPDFEKIRKLLEQ